MDSDYKNLKGVCRQKLKDRISRSKFYKSPGSNKFGENRDAAFPEPIIFGRAMCYSEEIAVPFTKYKFKKENFGLFVVLIDFLVIICIILFIWIISMRQREFVDAFKDDTIQIDDYTIKVKNLPKDVDFDYDELILKAKLHDHFTKMLYLKDNSDKLDVPDEFDPAAGNPKYQIADICFGRQV